MGLPKSTRFEVFKRDKCGRRQSVLLDTSETELEILRSAYRVAFPGWELNQRGQADARRLVRRYGLREFLAALHRSACEAVVLDEHGEATPESLRCTWQRCGKHLHWEVLCTKDPLLAKLLYASGTLRRRVNLVDNSEALRLLTEAANNSVPHAKLQREATTYRLIEQAQDGGRS